MKNMNKQTGESDWQNFFPGIRRKVLTENVEADTAVVLLQYEPGSSVPLHYHEGREILYVLSGSQSDGNGVYKQGDLVVNEKGSSHQVFSETGCEVLIIYEKPVRFINDEKE